MIDFILIMSIFWIGYGILGIFGIQRIPSKHRGTEYEKDYKKTRGIGWILSGAPWLIVYFVVKSLEVSDGAIIAILIATAIPGIIYSVKMESKYAVLANKSQKQAKDQKNGSHPKKKGKKHK